MKRIIVLFCTLFFIVGCFISCTNGKTNTNSHISTESVVSLTSTNVIYSSTTKTDIYTTEESSSINTQTAITNHTEPSTYTPTEHIQIIGNYERLRDIHFDGFFYYKPDLYYSKEYPYLLANDRSYLKTSTSDFSLDRFVIFTVVGYSGVESDYYVSVLNYKTGKKDEKTYIFRYSGGTPNELCYGFFRLEIGEKYLACIPEHWDFDSTGYYSCRLFKIDENNEKIWVYPDYYTDFSYLKCAIKICDSEEDLFYKNELDYDIISFMEKNNISNTYFGYKCELDLFVKELCDCKEINTNSFSHIGEYSNLLQNIEFDGFAEYPENLRLDNEHPYLLKNPSLFSSVFTPDYDNRPIIVTIIGFKGEEESDEGLLFSYYYVYAQPTVGNGKCYDDTIYIMQVLGTPSHPYFGQRRIEIGDKYLRLYTDRGYLISGYLPYTELLYINKEDDLLIVKNYYAKTGYGLDLSDYIKSSSSHQPIYKEGRDDDIIEYLNKNKIPMPTYDTNIFTRDIHNILPIYEYLNGPYFK